MNGICPNFSDPKIAEDFNKLVIIVGEDPAYYLWDKYLGDFNQAFIEAQLISSNFDENYKNHSQAAREVLLNEINSFKKKGYQLSDQTKVEQVLSQIRSNMLSGMKSIMKVVDQIGANKSDEFKANLKYQITNLQDNTISDIENIVYFIKTLSQDLVPVAQEILNAVKSNNVLTDERIHSLDRNYFGFYNPLIKDIKDIAITIGTK